MNGVETNGNGHNLGNGLSHDEAGIKGNVSVKGTVELPHVTSNIIPLSNVLKFYCQESYKQLTTMIENLSATRGKENDVLRKKKFLSLLVELRKDFIKIYTLVKWASKSPEVNKLIDILNWLRTQEFYFEQLSLGLNGLNGFSGAKLPNSDLTTSLEVLTKGRPQLPTYNYFKTPELSTEKIIQVLEDMNLVLTTRIALNDEIPVELLKNHQIEDGKVVFCLNQKYEAIITVGDDTIAELESSYTKSPYFLINFKFLFGIDSENILRTDITTTLPKDFWHKLESQANNVLLSSNLSGMYELLNRFTKKFKFNLIHQQLKDSKLLAFSHIRYKLHHETIVINYWNNPLNNIEISINDDFSIGFKWYKNDQETSKKDIFINDDEFNIEVLINSILNKHCETLMAEISKTTKFSRLINPYQILIKLSDKKTTILSIDSLTGQFYFLEPSFIDTQILHKINQFLSSKNPGEDVLLDFISKRLIELKLESISREIRNRIITIEWISNHIITLKDQELAKLGQVTGPFKIQFFKCKNWPSSWFLINLINDSFEMDWFVSRIKSTKGEWKLEWVSDLQIGSVELNFNFFNGLSNICSNKIIDSMILSELNTKRIEFVEIDQGNKVLKDFKLDLTANNHYQLILLVYNNGQYLPVKTSSNCLILVVSLSDGGITVTLRTKLNLQFDQFDKLNLNNIQIIEGDRRFLEVKEHCILKDNKLDLDLKIIGDVFESLSVFNRSLTLVNELIENDVTILHFNNHIKTKINDLFDELYFQVTDRCQDESAHPSGTANYYFKYAENATTDVKLFVNFINKSLCSSRNHTLIEIINYMNYIKPIIEGIHKLRNHVKSRDTYSLPNGLLKLNFDLKLVNLNNIQLLFNLNHANPQNNKKVVKDKIILNIKFRLNKFKVSNKLELNVSLIDNINIKNLRYKKLFEIMFKTLNGNDKVINLNYDFVVDLSIFDEFLIGIGNCFLNYIESDA